MKKLTLVLSCILGLAFLAGVGCNSKPKLSTALVKDSIASASEEDKARVQPGIDAAEKGDYAGAYVLLEDVSYDLEDPEQQAAVMDFVEQLKAMLGQEWETAVEAAREKLEAGADAAGDAVEAVKEAAGDAAEAVKEGAAEAADALKPPSE
ncbi:MAG: hypothetical protein H7A47_00500 [Verrucomicrobiales bacterium]|nr:hypothetical protein [Verrucomicrobiales bacterium]